ncbi:MAG: PEP-CTERM sorting domain-containing protein [Steroidobacteraceae bacterium]
MNRLSKFGIIAALAGTMAVGTAFAGPIEMVISSGAYSTSLLVGNSGLPSTVAYTGSLNGWDINSNTGGTSYSPFVNQLVGIDLGGYTVTCSGIPGTGCSSDPLTIAISATGFTTPISPNGFQMQFSGNVNGGVANTQAFFDTMNNGGNYFCNDTGSTMLGSQCGWSNMIGSLTLTQPSLGITAIGGPIGSTIRSYSLTVVDTFSTSSTGFDPSYSVDTTLVQAPEPGALAMFAAGLLGCALFINRRRRASRES